MFDFEEGIVLEHNFEKDLEKLKVKILDDKYAQKVYAALCNVVWIHSSRPENYKQIQEESWITGTWLRVDWDYSCSWRSAGGLVASIQDKGGDYMDFYCSGDEGNVDQEVAKDLKVLGWEPDVDNEERWQNVRDNQAGINELDY